jgi:hypothetical protein
LKLAGSRLVRSAHKLQEDRQMTTLLDKKRSVIGNVQNPDQATLDQVLSRISARRWPTLRSEGLREI